MQKMTPESLGLESAEPRDTYLDEYAKVWIGSKWDIAETTDGLGLRHRR